MFKEKNHYGDFLKSEEKIATNILADRLSLLEKEGIVIKSADPSHGSKFIYKLSSKGIDLLPILVEIILWSAKYDDKTAADMRFVKSAGKDKQGLINSLSASLRQ